MLPEWELNQVFSYRDGNLILSRAQAAAPAPAVR
jgi:hypothetical protein